MAAEMKLRSIKTTDEQWARWKLEGEELGLDRSSYIRQAVNAFGESGVDDGAAALVKAQAQLDAANDEIAQLKRQLAKRPQPKPAPESGPTALEPKAQKVRQVLPGLSGGQRWACSNCDAINVKGRCAAHPTAKQRKL